MSTVSLDEKRKRHARKLWYWYGLTLQDFDGLLEAQRHCCAMCSLPFGAGQAFQPCVDHNHKTGAIRGLIHGVCNTRIGRFNDDPEALETAALYLRTARTPFNADAGNWRKSLARQRQYRARK
jgi:hypothetical protein